VEFPFAAHLHARCEVFLNDIIEWSGNKDKTMRHYRYWGVVLAILGISLALYPHSAAAEGWLVGLLKKPYIGAAPNNARNPGRNAAVPPAHQRYYAYNVEDYPWFNNGFAVPTYNWGYFGARYRPATIGQDPYNNDYSGFSYRPAD
jgi:hypothetical protein